MIKSIAGLTLNCLIVIALLTSCSSPTITDEDTVSTDETPQTEEETISEEQEIEENQVTEETTEEKEQTKPPEEEAATEEDEETEEVTEPEEELTIPPSMPRGTEDPSIAIDVYKIDKAYNGTTLLADNHDHLIPRIIEVNMLGEVVWEYILPDDMKKHTNPGFDVELLANDNVLFVLPGKGVYEINREGDIVWSYLTSKISHDADRLPDGNTIFVYGNSDQKSDPQVTEVNEEGQVVWTWYARDDFDEPPYSTISNEGWTHTNSVTRMDNGNTLISPRNFCRLIEVDSGGEVVRTIGDGVIFASPDLRLNASGNADPFSPHDPEILPNGNILMVSQYFPMRAIEMVPDTGEVVWEYALPERMNYPVRDADRLPNGNILITGAIKITEVTPGGEVVWQLSMQGVTWGKGEGQGLGYYKAERIGL
ncbi:aryl-sulfate sulfotransferase [Chloroflexota bacterium]